MAEGIVLREGKPPSSFAACSLAPMAAMRTEKVAAELDEGGLTLALAKRPEAANSGRKMPVAET